MPHPVRLFGSGERVEVEHRLPLGLAARVTGDRRPAPDAADVIGILPEIINLAADEIADRDAVLGLGDVQRLFVILGVARIGLEHSGRPGVVLLDPLHGLGRGNVLEPDVGVVGRARGTRNPRRKGRRHHRQRKLVRTHTIPPAERRRKRASAPESIKRRSRRRRNAADDQLSLRAAAIACFNERHSRPRRSSPGCR